MVRELAGVLRGRLDDLPIRKRRVVGGDDGAVSDSDAEDSESPAGW